MVAIQKVKNSNNSKLTEDFLAFDPLDKEHCSLFIVFFYENLKYNNGEFMLQYDTHDKHKYQFFGPRYASKSTLQCKLSRGDKDHKKPLNANDEIENEDSYYSDETLTREDNYSNSHHENTKNREPSVLSKRSKSGGNQIVEEKKITPQKSERDDFNDTDLKPAKKLKLRTFLEEYGKYESLLDNKILKLLPIFRELFKEFDDKFSVFKSQLKPLETYK